MYYRETIVSRFLKGSFTLRPAPPQYKEVWDVNIVLEHLKTLHPTEFIFKRLTSKLGLFIAIILSGQRCQTIHALSPRDMQVSDSKAVFSVNECLKITKPGKYLTKL